MYIDSQDWSAPFEVNVSAAAEIGPRAIPLLGNNGDRSHPRRHRRFCWAGTTVIANDGVPREWLRSGPFPA